MALYYSKNWVNFIGFIDGDDAFFWGIQRRNGYFFFKHDFLKVLTITHMGIVD